MPWYLIRDGKEQGPIADKQLKDMAAKKRLAPTDHVRRHDHQSPIQAGTIKGLFSEKPKAPNKPMTAVDSAIPVDALKRRFTEFANTIPHHEHRNLGDEITIVGANRLSTFWIEWTTLFQSREVVSRQCPYDGTSAIPPQTVDANTLDPWSQRLPAAASFDRATAEWPVEASHQVLDCGTCSATGAVVCDGCAGEETVTCPGCSGSGSMLCRACSGTGQLNKSRNEQRQRACTGGFLGSACRGGYDHNGNPCTTCNGSGIEHYNHVEYYQEQCLACQAQGQVVCIRCRGGCIIDCPRCQGHGRLVCAGCEGSGQVVDYLAIVQSHQPQTDTSEVPAEGCPKESIEAFEETDFEEVLNRSNLQSEPDLSLVGELQGVHSHLRVVRDKVRTQGGNASRPSGAEFRIYRADTYRLDYSLGGTTYVAWFTGKNYAVHAPVNPVTDQVSQWIEDAVAEWSAGDEKQAVDKLRKVLAMAKGQSQCAAQLESRRASVPEPLMKKASSFSVTFWFAHLSQWAKVGVVAAAVCILLFCSGFVTLMTVYSRVKSQTQEELTEAQSLWDKGDKAAAIEIYRGILDSRTKRPALTKEERPLVYGRVIDFDVESGNREAALELIKAALKRKVKPDVKLPEAKRLLVIGTAN